MKEIDPELKRMFNKFAKQMVEKYGRGVRIEALIFVFARQLVIKGLYGEDAEDVEPASHVHVWDGWVIRSDGCHEFRRWGHFEVWAILRNLFRDLLREVGEVCDEIMEAWLNRFKEVDE
jgi:hypothetical protein